MVAWHPFAFHWVVGSLGSSGSGGGAFWSGGVGFCGVAWLPFVFRWSSAGLLTVWGLPALGGRASSQGARSSKKKARVPVGFGQVAGFLELRRAAPSPLDRLLGRRPSAQRRRGGLWGFGEGAGGTILGVPEIPSPTPPQDSSQISRNVPNAPPDIFAISQDVDVGSVSGLRHLFDISGTF